MARSYHHAQRELLTIYFYSGVIMLVAFVMAIAGAAAVADLAMSTNTAPRPCSPRDIVSEFNKVGL